jgi:hypothetical protein
MRRQEGGIGCGARGRGSYPPHPGGPNQPSAGTKTGRLQWLDVAGTKGGGSRPDQGREERLRREAWRQGLKSPPWRAERRRAFANERAHIMNGSADRRTIPSSRLERGKGKAEYGRTRRPSNNTGDRVCLGAYRASPARAALACRAEAQRRRAV